MLRTPLFGLAPEVLSFFGVKFKKETLTGPIGSVYFWTSNTIHGTAPQKKNDENFRVSLRFIIEKNRKSRGLIDKIISQSKIGKVRENK